MESLDMQVPLVILKQNVPEYFFSKDFYWVLTTFLVQLQY